MNMDNLDDEEKARHKQQQIEYRNKKRFSSIFLFIATIFEIIETFLIILLLIIGSVAVTTRFVDVNSALFSNILGIIIIVFSLGGLVIGFIIYKKVTISIFRSGNCYCIFFFYSLTSWICFSNIP